MKNLIEKYNLTEGIILYALKRFDSNLRYYMRKIPLDDILQTIRYEMLNGAQNHQELYRNSHAALRQLLNDFGYGYTGKNRKEYGLRYNDDGEIEEIADDGDHLDSYDRQLIDEILAIYEQRSTRAVCEKYGIQYNSTIASAFNRYFPKNMGHGGKRTGSGNKKGWNKNKKLHN